MSPIQENLMAEAIDSDESFKTRDAGSYDAVTDTFDRLIDRFTCPVAERMVALAHAVGDRGWRDVVGDCGDGRVGGLHALGLQHADFDALAGHRHR